MARAASGHFLARRTAPVAQLDRAPDYESGGQEFESLRARQIPVEPRQRRKFAKMSRPARVRSIGIFAQQQSQRYFSGAIGFRHGFETSLGAVNRTGSAGAIDLPLPCFWSGCSVLYDNGKVGMIDHGKDIIARRCKMVRKLECCGSFSSPPIKNRPIGAVFIFITR